MPWPVCLSPAVPLHWQPYLCCVARAGHCLLVLDNFSNSSPVAIKRVRELANVSLSSEKLELVRGDIRDTAVIERLFCEAKAANNPIEAVIHFAGLKAVGESVADPLRYWDVNVCGTRTLLAAMEAHGCRTMVFSSTSTVLGKQPTRQTTPPSVTPTPRPNLPLNSY